MPGRLLNLLRLPEARQMANLDDVGNQRLIRRILARKPFLRQVYRHFYRQIIDRLGTQRPVIELGSGAGFFRRLRPDAITSDVLPYSGLDLCFSGTALPFADASLGAIAMVDVFHHVPDAARFLGEMQRCLRPGGRVVMIEPADTWFGRFIYRRFHHEGFDPQAGWCLPPGGPLSTANMALPSIVFIRDRERFAREFPLLALDEVTFFAPLQYLLSGGLSLRQLLPSSAWTAVARLERWLAPFNHRLGMFMIVVLRRRPAATGAGPMPPAEPDTAR